MNLDANVQKLIIALLRKWKLIVSVAMIGIVLAYCYTANFTNLTYSSSVEFLAYAQDSNQDLSDSSTTAQQASNTSKMNYAIKMLDTYIELFKTNEFNQSVANEINENYSTSYSASNIKNAITIEDVAGTAMFKITVTTTDPDLSYQIAHQLETSIPNKMAATNNGTVRASVEDVALKATTSESRGYAKKMLLGAIVGAGLAAAYIILRELIDVRIKNSDELTDKYGIPVLGTIPEFDLKVSTSKPDKKVAKGDVQNG